MENRRVRNTYQGAKMEKRQEIQRSGENCKTYGGNGGSTEAATSTGRSGTMCFRRRAGRHSLPAVALAFRTGDLRLEFAYLTT
uniref:Uncharacterized protein n=1 Tax=Oryza brachyantha TaxID=4533 RepID=J3LU63_ORYBR